MVLYRAQIYEVYLDDQEKKHFFSYFFTFISSDFYAFALFFAGGIGRFYTLPALQQRSSQRRNDKYAEGQGMAKKLSSKIRKYQILDTKIFLPSK